MTLQEVIDAAKKLSDEERLALLEALQSGTFVPTAQQRLDIDRALAAVESRQIVPEADIRAMLRGR